MPRRVGHGTMDDPRVRAPTATPARQTLRPRERISNTTTTRTRIFDLLHANEDLYHASKKRGIRVLWHTHLSSLRDFIVPAPGLRPALSTRPLSMPLSRRTVARREASSTLVRRPNRGSLRCLLCCLRASLRLPTSSPSCPWSPSRVAERAHNGQRPSDAERIRRAGAQRPSESDFDVTSFQTVRTPRLESRVEGLGARLHSSARFHSFPKKSSV